MAIATLSGTATASAPTLMWSGAKRVQILCNVVGGPGIDQGALTVQLCGEVKLLAGRRAPLPVDVISFGDPAVLSSDAVTLLVHASISRDDRNRLLAFSIRPYRVSDSQAGVLFGAVPRAVALRGPHISGIAVAAAIDAALSGTLPWRSAWSIQPIN
ncbi:MAG: hypothetical protein LH610_05430 [Sphingomonas bacterium]|nr:hypothetical protein [Sphingomonas bacterium]